MALLRECVYRRNKHAIGKCELKVSAQVRHTLRVCIWEK